MLFVNTTNPFLQIYNPATGGFAQFQGGKLELDESDPNFAVVQAEALRNPLISIMVNATTCHECGEVFSGKAAKPQLGAHRKAIHFDSWVAEKVAEDAEALQVEIKSRAGYACDVCSPIQTFGTTADLSNHVKLLHANPPILGENGEDTAATDPGEPAGGQPIDTDVPAAKRSAKG